MQLAQGQAAGVIVRGVEVGPRLGAAVELGLHRLLGLALVQDRGVGEDRGQAAERQAGVGLARPGQALPVLWDVGLGALLGGHRRHDGRRRKGEVFRVDGGDRGDRVEALDRNADGGIGGLDVGPVAHEVDLAHAGAGGREKPRI